MVFKIMPLAPKQHIRAGFCCGQESLDHDIQTQASQDLKKRVCTVFVCIDEPNMTVLGYYTLSAYTVTVTDLRNNFAQKLPRYPRLPATLLGRLAVTQTCKGQGLGKLLLIDALKKSWHTAQQVGSLAVIVEALDAPALNFYQKYGFQPFQQEPMKLYLPMQSIDKLFSPI
ncbi:GNAT family N-acetyltransferase [Spirulina sp. CCNP1310]|uniref:GNAT family N-acetyltransferase n=1 Tax=Spirulina sp. CCNP1310 TaxID=3110249 RepID=UPI002B1F0FF0|nr:GNAT family N-acetyltransferase [Spirulina sp. CCNP1310]MEA5421570.1 GNAT family N-acetyltransferase [Spirulina sp. CCNP1310]